MTTNNNMGVKKRHQNTKNMLNTNIFFSSNRGHEMLKVEGIGHNTKKYIRAITSTKVENILYNIFKQGIVGNHGKNDVGGPWKGPKKILLK